jgi:hypothetical protein
MVASGASTTKPRRLETSRRVAWWLFGTGLAALLASFALRAISGRPTQVADITQTVGFLAIGVAGLAIASRRPENAVGWLYLGIWCAVALGFALGSEYGYWATIAHPGAPGGTLAVWLGNWVWVPIFGALLTFTFLLFPDGHLPSPRWRPVAWASAAAVYFCSLEALQNVAKYANASRASVRLAQVDGSLTFEVTDDGEGFDSTSTGYGTGLQGMADRLDALGGTLEVRSAPGRGTLVRGQVPSS